MKIFSERLKSLRLSKNITQRQLANSLGITERNYQRFEATKSVLPSTKNLIFLANYFNVSLDYLVGRSDDPTRH